MKHLFVSLLILLGLLAIAEGKTLKVDTLAPSVSDGDLTLLPDGTGDIVLGTFSGVLKSSSGVLSAGTVDLTSEITGTLPIANGGTGSASQNFVDLTTGQSIAGDKTLSGTINVTGKLTTTSTVNGAIPCPKMTEAQRDAIGVPVAGDCVFNTDTQKLNTYDGTATAWVVAGGGAGGGLDAFLSEDFETTQASDFSTGNNATFLTAGSPIDGALANETSSPIAGARSLKYTASTASTNDWIASNEISLDAKQRGQFVGISFYYKWSGSVDVEFVAQCTAGDMAEFTDSLDVITTATNNTRFSTSIFISSSCTALKYGFHFVNAPTNGDVLVFDDVEFSTNPFVYKNLLDKQYSRYDDIAGFGSTATKIPYFTTATTNTGSGIYSISNDSTNGFVITVLRKAHIWINGQTDTSSGDQAGLSINTSAVTTGFVSLPDADRLAEGSTSAQVNQFMALREFEVGDVIRLHHNSNTTIDDARTFIEITAWTESEHVRTPIKSNIVSVLGAGNGGTGITADTTNIPFTEVSDANSAWDGDSYAVQKANSVINIKLSMYLTATVSEFISLYKNGSLYKAMGAQTSSALHSGSYESTKGEFAIGDVLSFRGSTNATLSNNTNYHHLSITEYGDASILGAFPLLNYAVDVDASEALTNNDDSFVSSCTNADPSVCTIQTGFFKEIPRCWTANGLTSGVTATTITSATVDRTDASTAFTLICKGKLE